jgi:hypothetical protein
MGTFSKSVSWDICATVIEPAGKSLSVFGDAAAPVVTSCALEPESEEVDPWLQASKRTVESDTQREVMVFTVLAP